MAFQYGPYTFDALGDADDDAFLYSGPKGDVTALASPYSDRAWNHDVDDTPSGGVGPTSGAGGNPDGYIYIETSGGTAFGDLFYVEKEAAANDGTPMVYDASNQDITVTFKTNQRGNDNNMVCELQTNESAAGWVTRFTCGGSSDSDKVATNGAQIWSARVVDLTGLISDASTRIRWQFTMPSSGTNFHNDYGVDEITIEGVDQTGGGGPVDESLATALLGFTF